MEQRALHFDVQLSEPYEHEIAWGEQKGQMTTSSRNVQLDIITSSARRAIDLALIRHPKGVIHVVQKRGMGTLIFDPDLNIGEVAQQA
jgi:hypothetical protein